MKLTQVELKSILRYDPTTGFFFWIYQQGNSIKKDTVAGGINDNRYRKIQINGVKHSAHRLVWLYVYGSFPEKETDHLNGNKDDNRVENLQDKSSRRNNQNKAKHRAGKLAGARLRKGSKMWYARIHINGKDLHLGTFKTAREAHEAYMLKCKEIEDDRTFFARSKKFL